MNALLDVLSVFIKITTSFALHVFKIIPSFKEVALSALLLVQDVYQTLLIAVVATWAFN